MSLNDIKFIKGNGGMGRTAASEDLISGLILHLPGLTATGLTATGFELVTVASGDSLLIAMLKYPEQLASFGIEEMAMDLDTQATLDNAALKNSAARNRIVYDVFEFFKMSPAGTLFLALKTDVLNVTKNDVKALQYFSEGSIRQIGILTRDVENISDYQIACTGTTGETGLEQEHQPLSILLTFAGLHDDVTTTGDGTNESPYVHVLSNSEGFDTLTLQDFTGETHTQAGRRNVSVLIGCDLESDLLQRLGNMSYYGCIGTALGALSAAKVNESIAWVAKFPIGLKVPGFISGDVLNEVTTLNLNLINDNRYIFIRKFSGSSDCYFNDNFTCDVATSDYAYINDVRTMDKATRGIYASLLPFLNSPIKVDATSGKLDLMDVSILENEANKPLEAMTVAGELSGYRVEINPDQNVLATGVIEFSIINIPTGIVRNMLVKISYSQSIK
jgi:hypothetical protein